MLDVNLGQETSFSQENRFLPGECQEQADTEWSSRAEHRSVSDSPRRRAAALRSALSGDAAGANFGCGSGEPGVGKERAVPVRALGAAALQLPGCAAGLGPPNTGSPDKSPAPPQPLRRPHTGTRARSGPARARPALDSSTARAAEREGAGGSGRAELPRAEPRWRGPARPSPVTGNRCGPRRGGSESGRRAAGWPLGGARVPPGAEPWYGRREGAAARGGAQH